MMAPIRNPDILIDELRQLFHYDPVEGTLTRLNGRVDFLGVVNPKALQVWLNGRRVFVARIAWALHTGAWPKYLIDHRDGDKTNIKITNLREATYQQNQYNRVGIGQYSKGVVFKADAYRAKPWSARIRIHGRKVAIGAFATEAEAAEAYRKKAEEIQGEFALHKSMEQSQ